MNEKYCARIEEIDGFRIIRHLEECTPDMAVINQKLTAMLNQNPALDINTAADALLQENTEYLSPGPGYAAVTGGQRETLAAKLAALGEHEELTLEGETIPDWRGVKYWFKDSGAWLENTITEIGRPFPSGGILDAALTGTQRDEISAQAEAGRVAALTPGQKAAEKEQRLNSLADEADRLSRRAEVKGEAFDKQAWYQDHSAGVEGKYS